MGESPLRFTVVGERVALGPLRRELYPLHAAWVNDPDVAWNVFGRHEPRSEAEESAWLDREDARDDTRLFLIYRLDEERPIGLSTLTDIGSPPGTGTFRISIGAARDRGKGFGEEASRLVIDHAFAVLGLKRLVLDVFEYNLPAQRLYARLGFAEFDRRRDRIHRDGRTWDAIKMALDRDAVRPPAKVNPRRWRAYRPTASSTVVGDLRVLPGLEGPWRGVPRDILVHLPAGAQTSGRRYPVLYMHDGQNLFDAATSFSGEWRVDEALAEIAAEGIDLIVVAIPNAGGLARGYEYTPYRRRIRTGSEMNHTGPTGAGSAYLRFLLETVKPAVDAAFPTRTDRAATGIMGSSWGALISLWGAVTHGATFGLLGAMSPAITPGQEPILARLRRLSPAPDRAWVDMGDHEGSFAPTPAQDRAWSRDGIRMARRVRDALATAGLHEPDRLCYVEEPGAIHHEAAWAGRLPDALRFLFGPVR
jgi:predicted alpha/beta superfamily hydrolase/RimJ/RimL family protein N-acetyltransferase